MLRKLSAFVAYTLVVVAVTVVVTQALAPQKPEAPPSLTAAQAIEQLNKEFRTDPEKFLTQVDNVLDASALLDGALLEYELDQKLVKMERDFAEATKHYDAAMREIEKTHRMLNEANDIFKNRKPLLIDAILEGTINGKRMDDKECSIRPTHPLSLGFRLGGGLGGGAPFMLPFPPLKDECSDICCSDQITIATDETPPVVDPSTYDVPPPRRLTFDEAEKANLVPIPPLED